MQFQNMILGTQLKGFLLEGKSATFEGFLSFVSKNFRCTKSNISHEHFLYCEQCFDAFAEFGPDLKPGELEMMAAIGKHLDEVPHTWNQVASIGCFPPVETEEDLRTRDQKWYEDIVRENQE